MRIPPYYKRPGWQRFLSGITVGLIFGFIFFMSLYGMAQERQIDKIKEQQTEIKSLQRRNETLMDDKEEKNEQLEKKLLVQDVKVNILVSKQKEIDRIILFELKEKIEERLHSLINNDIESISSNLDLIYKAIEGHPFMIDKVAYHFKIQDLVIKSVVEVSVKIIDAKGNNLAD
ncbi:hypothetical protein EV207_10155 [Scopulibacillus darangshiensis]|uniref:Sporulation membrane protein YtrI C-terminal domain-containing protein n=1 Tax=Scopulibacillus darangshiensis TaxID=442528 RepID=A0A4R2PAR5_9BACL|nr:sporulation membrane protein YtrI [Scopulibacillus darangshiensis]TCP32082.1 hypothetical protein EV207_10155 [Scopulibacillus darangshiensis]